MQVNRSHPVFAAALIGADLALPPDAALVDLVERAVRDFAGRPRTVHAHSWRPGGLLNWSNRAAPRRAMSFDDLDHKRDLCRTTINYPWLVRAPGMEHAAVSA